MFVCQIELLSYLDPENSPIYWVVATYVFDPGLQKDEDFFLNGWEVWGEIHHLKLKVRERKKEVIPDGRLWLDTINKGRKEVLSMLNPSGFQTLERGSGLFLLRIIVEAEDRDKMLQIRDTIVQNSPQQEGS